MSAEDKRCPACGSYDHDGRSSLCPLELAAIEEEAKTEPGQQSGDSMSRVDPVETTAAQVIANYFASVRKDGYIVDGVSAAELAAVVVAALQLTQEWAVLDDDGHAFATWHKSRESAEKHCATIVRNFWVTHKDVSGACMVEPHPAPVSRLVGRWVGVSGGTATKEPTNE